MSGKTEIKLEGAAELEKIFKTFPSLVVRRTAKTGLRRGGARYRTLLRRDAPRISGNLRKSITSKSWKNGTVTVGLNTRFYYLTLDRHTKRGPPLAAWFDASLERHAPAISQTIIDSAKQAIFGEAGKAYSRSKSKLRR